MTHENVAIVGEVIEEWNRGDVEALIERATKDFEWHPALVGSLGGGSFRGRDGFRRFFEDWEKTWEKWHLGIQELRPVGNQVVALTRVHAKGLGSGLELDQPIAQLFELRDGLICRGQTFLDQQEALAAAEQRAAKAEQR
jgi:ketosteroid isomerase-like protein